MLFSEIVENLREFCDIEVLSSSLNEEITAVQFMDSRQRAFKHNVLYFSNSEQLISGLPPQCVIAGSVEPGDYVPEAHNLGSVADKDFGFALNHAFRLLEESNRDGYYEHMMKTLERVQDVDTLIDIASQTFGASLVFIDREFRILSSSTQVPVTDKLWKRNIEQGYCDYEFIQAVLSLKSVQMADSSSNPIEVSCPSSPFQKFSSRVYCRDTWIGFLIVIEGHDSYRPQHVEMLRILSGILGYAVMKYAPNYLYMTSDYHQFLYNLIIGADVSSLPEAYRQLPFPDELQVLYCKATGDRSAFPQEATLSDVMTMILPGCHVIAQRDNAVIIGSCEIVQKSGMILASFPAKSGTRIGISRPVTNISDLKSHYEEAVDAFEIGFRLEPDVSIYMFEDYGIYVMFRTVAEHEDLSRYLHPALPKLETYDRENGSSLTTTLHAYLKHSCNTTDTAEALFLHRNSVIYRLRRIEELCDIDLNDTDTRFRLRLSYAISNVVNQKRIWNGKVEAPASRDQ